MVLFEARYHALGPEFSAMARPVPIAAPKMVRWNTELANELGLDDLSADAALGIFSGQDIAEQSTPLAAAYAGHQFGNFVPVLGDGRAHLLGERTGKDGLLYDIQLKGSGQTSFSRRGDGRAGFGPVLREYVVSEAMHALGIPTTRSLTAVVSETDVVVRQTPQPAAIVTRVARTHVRVGTFQYFAARGQYEQLSQLLTFTAERLNLSLDDPTDFLAHAIDRQINLIPQWMNVGFVHGVMNTDNTAVSGETIDFGPCAFLEEYDPLKVFSSIDHYGRYAFMRQKDIIFWNLSQLASALVPLMPDEQTAVQSFTQMLHEGLDKMEDRVTAMWARKLNIAAPCPENTSAELITSVLECIRRSGADFTQSFVSLEPDGTPLDTLVRDADTEQLFENLKTAQDQHLRSYDPYRNPRRIPRNHVIEAMIEQAVQGNYNIFDQVMSELRDPFSDDPTILTPAPIQSRVQTTFCGT